MESNVRCQKANVKVKLIFFSSGFSIQTGIPWDNNTGYFLDASILGLAIENHLKNGDNKGQRRRATFCTLSETNDQLLGQPTSLGGQTLGTPTNR